MAAAVLLSWGTVPRKDSRICLMISMVVSSHNTLFGMNGRSTGPGASDKQGDEAGRKRMHSPPGTNYRGWRRTGQQTAPVTSKRDLAGLRQRARRYRSAHASFFVTVRASPAPA